MIIEVSYETILITGQLISAVGPKTFPFLVIYIPTSIIKYNLTRSKTYIAELDSIFVVEFYNK